MLGPRGVAVERKNGSARGEAKVNMSERLNSSTMAYISRAPGPWGSRMNSGLSRGRIMFVEDRKGRSSARSSGFSTPAPTALESLARK